MRIVNAIVLVTGVSVRDHHLWELQRVTMTGLEVCKYRHLGEVLPDPEVNQVLVSSQALHQGEELQGACLHVQMASRSHHLEEELVRAYLHVQAAS